MKTIDTGSLMAMRNAILQQNSALQKAAGGADAAGSTKESSFAGDAKAGAVSEAYERGETTDIAAVMLSREQASVGFQATLQVRNKLLSAYKDIMSMPV
jgi:flagellar hook-basal body complex protein FliE